MNLDKYPETKVNYIIQKHEDDIEMIKKKTAILEEIALKSLLLATYCLVNKALKK